MYNPKLISCLKHYDKKTLSADIMAGIIVGIVALPLAIAFGIASGVSPEKGIITAIVAGLLVSVFGGSKVQIGGPTGAFIIIIYGIIEQYGMSGLTIATFMAGAFLVLFGLLRLGTIIQYIPYPIVVGFTSGIAITIFSTQVKDFFGMQIEKVPSDFVEKWICYANNVSTIDLWSLFIGMLSLVTIIVLPRISKKIPGSLIAIILTTVVALVLRNYLGITSIETIGDRFSISSDMPGADVPELSWLTMKGLVQPDNSLAWSHRVIAVGDCGRRCHRRPPQLEQRADRPGHSKPCHSNLRRHPGNRSHSAHYDEYQQWRTHPCGRNNPCRCAATHIPVPYASRQVYSDGVPGRHTCDGQL